MPREAINSLLAPAPARARGGSPISARMSAEELHAARVKTAKRRVLRVLRARVVAYRRELERQVCEVGFNFATAEPADRPEPEHFSPAIEQLRASGEIGQRHVSIGAVKYVFWHSTDASSGTIEPVLERKSGLADSADLTREEDEALGC